MPNLKQDLEKIMFDFHIRGCTPGNDMTNKICAENKDFAIGEIMTLLKSTEKPSKPRKATIRLKGGVE